VTFGTSDQQKKALSAVDGKDLDGRTLTVKVAHKDDRRDARGELKEEFKTDTREPRKPRRGGGEGGNAGGDRRPPADRKPAADKKPSETVLYVSNLPFEFTDAELSKVFAAHNPVSARIGKTWRCCRAPTLVL
jgi:RNA recognition motif-containing protein